MDILKSRCREHQQYPKHYDVGSRILAEYYRRLSDREASLFCDPDQALLEFWDLGGDSQDFGLGESFTQTEVQELCPFRDTKQSQDHSKPLHCRFIFLYSRDSRSSLWILRDMLTYSLAYHQVQPWFLDFLFPFGEQDSPQDFRFSSFRHKYYLHELDVEQPIPTLRRSGRGYHICYNLKSVERTLTNTGRPWSLRQTVLYHSFDASTGQAFWIVLKGNDSMRTEIMSASNKLKWKDQDPVASFRYSFQASLSIHLLVCEWSRENWRWYINDLEAKVDQLTHQGVDEKVQEWSEKPLPLHGQSREKRKAREEMSDLQEALFIEEKANEAILALKSDVSNLRSLKAHYVGISGYVDFSTIPKNDTHEFTSQIDEIINDLEVHQSSLEALVRLITDRKAMLFAILEYKNMLASRSFAAKAQASTDNMEKLTKQTTRETVSMKVITLVTMFFLPGTFISTLMSTDIVRFEHVGETALFEKQVSTGALWLFVSLTLPLTFGTFAIWFFVYCVISWRERVVQNDPALP